MEHKDKVAEAIAGFMLSGEAAGSKMKRLPGGALWDADSNWGFDPARLAIVVLKAIQAEPPLYKGKDA